MKPDLMTATQLSEMLGIPVATITDWRYNRTGPNYIKIGRHIRYRRSDVEAFIASKTIIL